MHQYQTNTKNSIRSNNEEQLLTNIKHLLRQQQAVLIAHFYTPPQIQQLAETTGGFVGDSLQMAHFGSQINAESLVVAGVRFMGETAKILNPEKQILMPSLAADCSLDFCCPAEEFAAFCKAHADREIVVYANTSAAVKALADWVVTSSNAVEIIQHLAAIGKKILWATDRYLGGYLQRVTGADMLLWNGSCIVHEKFKAKGLLQLKNAYPEAAVLVHPESPPAVIALADVVGSTSQLLAASQRLPNPMFIVATEVGILYQMQQKSPNKIFLIAPVQGNGANCKSCASCPWMAMNSLINLEKCLINHSQHVIEVPRKIMQRALIPLERMLNFSYSQQQAPANLTTP